MAELLPNGMVAHPKYYPGISGVNIRPADYDYRAEVVAFHENDRNCNTCKHLERVAHPKDKFGFLFGRCKSTPINMPYKLRDNGAMMFHPDDAMLMDCYESRFR